MGVRFVFKNNETDLFNFDPRGSFTEKTRKNLK